MPYVPKFPCMICKKAAKWNQKCVQCNLCYKWYHADCMAMNSSLYYEHVDHPSVSWTCSFGCGMPQFWRFSHSLFQTSSSSDTTQSSPSSSSKSTNQSPTTSHTTYLPPSATSTPTQTVVRPQISPPSVSTTPNLNLTLDSNTSSIKPAQRNQNELLVI